MSYVISGGGGGGGPATVEIINKTQKDAIPLDCPATDHNITGITLAATPVGGGYVEVSVNGMEESLSVDGNRDSANFYFSADGGATAVGIYAVGNVLYFNGARAGYALAAATDKISLDYLVTV